MRLANADILAGPDVFDQPMVMLDFETTGLSPDAGDCITEVPALRMVNGVVAERFVTLINCGMRIPSCITALTGISQQIVDGAPPVRQVLPQLLDFIGGYMLASHNASFDARFLLAESRHQGLTPRNGGLICSLKLTRQLLPGCASYKLGALTQSSNIRFGSAAHRAEADPEVTVRLLDYIGNHLCHTYACSSIAPSLLEAVNGQSAAKVLGFLARRFATLG
ncbi:MAG: 3'-5' exonuclease [Rhodanobacter sp.]